MRGYRIYLDHVCPTLASEAGEVHVGAPGGPQILEALVVPSELASRHSVVPLEVLDVLPDPRVPVELVSPDHVSLPVT